MNTPAPKGNAIETQAQGGRGVNVRRKPKARPPRTNVLTMKAIRNARLAFLSPEFMIALTAQITDPAPLTVDCKPERHRRVHRIRFVRRQNRHNTNLSTPTLFSDHLRVYSSRLFFHRAQIINLNLATARTRKLMPLLTGESHLKHIAAFEAANRHRHRKLPFHSALSHAERTASATRHQYTSSMKPKRNRRVRWPDHVRYNRCSHLKSVRTSGCSPAMRGSASAKRGASGPRNEIQKI